MAMNKPKLVILLSRFPYPLEKGDKLRAYYQIKELSEHFSIFLFCTTDKKVEPENLNELKSYCAEINVYTLTKFGLLYSLIRALLQKGSIQVAYFYRFSIKKSIERKLSEINPDLIYCQLVRVSEYVKNYHNCPKVLDYMDVLSVGMQRRIKTSPLLIKWFFKREYNALKSYESTVFDYFEAHTIISEQDRSDIHHPNQKKIQIVKNGVDNRFFEVGKEKVPKKYDILFCGNMSYPPNIEAAMYLAKQVVPALEKNGIACKILIAGANPTDTIKQLSSPSITVSGWMDDIREAYRSSSIFVAPMFIGTGLQNKLLEAMASGLPCVTTALANNALGGKDGENIHLAENIVGFVEKITLLKENGIIFNSTTTNGQKFVEQEYTWYKQNKNLIGLLESLLS